MNNVHEETKQAQFYVCRYCSSVFFHKTIFMKHVNNHEIELKLLRRNFLKEVDELLIPKGIEEMARLEAVLKFVLSGSIDEDDLKAVGLEKYTPLFRFSNDRKQLLEVLKPVFWVIADSNPDLIMRLMKELGPRIDPEIAKELQKRWLETLSYVA